LAHGVFMLIKPLAEHLPAIQQTPGLVARALRILAARSTHSRTAQNDHRWFAQESVHD